MKHDPVLPFSLLPTLCRAAAIAGLGLALASAVPAQATPLVDLLANDIQPMTEQLRKDLKLTPNQQTLWHQTEQRTRAILAERQQRRARLQAETETLLRTPGAEFRDLARGYDDDGTAAEQEARQLREVWFSMADALDDGQRKIVQDYILDRMQRVNEGPGGRSESGRSGRGAPPSGGMGGVGGSSMGGMGNRSTSGSFGSDSNF